MNEQQYRILAADWQQQLHDAAMTRREREKREQTVAALLYAADQANRVTHLSVPTREQIAEALWKLDMDLPWTSNPRWQAQYLERAEVVLALLNGADR